MRIPFRRWVICLLPVHACCGFSLEVTSDSPGHRVEGARVVVATYAPRGPGEGWGLGAEQKHEEVLPATGSVSVDVGMGEPFSLLVTKSGFYPTRTRADLVTEKIVENGVRLTLRTIEKPVQMAKRELDIDLPLAGKDVFVDVIAGKVLRDGAPADWIIHPARTDDGEVVISANRKGSGYFRYRNYHSDALLGVPKKAPQVDYIEAIIYPLHDLDEPRYPSNTLGQSDGFVFSVSTQALSGGDRHAIRYGFLDRPITADLSSAGTGIVLHVSYYIGTEGETSLEAIRDESQ